MDACDNEIEAGKHMIGVVERSVRQDVRLDTFEDAETCSKAAVQTINFRMLGFDLPYRKPARVMRRLRVVAHPEIPVTPLTRRLRHLLERGNAV